MKQIESERKYLLSRFPDIIPSAVYHIVQAYSEDGTRVRIKTKVRGLPTAVEYTETRKVGTGQVRVEDEVMISPEDANARIKDCKYRVEKLRFEVKDMLTWEVDLFLDMPLVLAEVEGIPHGYKPIKPAWLMDAGQSDVTDIIEFSNFNIAKDRYAKGSPPIYDVDAFSGEDLGMINRYMGKGVK